MLRRLDQNSYTAPSGVLSKFRFLNAFYDSGRASTCTNTQQAVFAALFKFADQQSGELFVSINTICQITGISRSAVLDALKSLKEIGVVEDIERGNVGRPTKRRLLIVSPMSSADKRLKRARRNKQRVRAAGRGGPASGTGGSGQPDTNRPITRSKNKYGNSGSSLTFDFGGGDEAEMMSVDEQLSSFGRKYGGDCSEDTLVDNAISLGLNSKSAHRIIRTAIRKHGQHKIASILAGVQRRVAEDPSLRNAPAYLYAVLQTPSKYEAFFQMWCNDASPASQQTPAYSHRATASRSDRRNVDTGLWESCDSDIVEPLVTEVRALFGQSYRDSKSMVRQCIKRGGAARARKIVAELRRRKEDDGFDNRDEMMRLLLYPRVHRECREDGAEDHERGSASDEYR